VNDSDTKKKVRILILHGLIAVLVELDICGSCVKFAVVFSWNSHTLGVDVEMLWYELQAIVAVFLILWQMIVCFRHTNVYL
jgi:uncharacterized membrane protein